MESLKNVIMNCSILDYKNQLEENRKKLFQLERKMSAMCFDLTVGKYVYYLDYQRYYQKKKQLTDREKKEMLEGQLLLSVLQDDPKVVAYRELEDDYLRLKRKCSEYYQMIQVVFREALKDVSLPNIFVYQGFLNQEKGIRRNRHIILQDAFEDYKETTPHIVIYPMCEFSSKRDARHFYNHVSFQYLEQLSQDVDFDPKIKRLGRVYIEENGKRI